MSYYKYNNLDELIASLQPVINKESLTYGNLVESWMSSNRGDIKCATINANKSTLEKIKSLQLKLENGKFFGATLVEEDGMPDNIILFFSGISSVLVIEGDN